MYKLIGKYGNDIAFTDDERKKDALIGLGFKLADEPKQTKKAVKPKK
ncbi:MAG: hypothetical protein ACI39F_03525 [Acutalibacteraceae bacterium]